MTTSRLLGRRGDGSAAVSGWVRLYTLGLPPAMRERRRSEVAGDLADETVDAIRRGERRGLLYQRMMRLALGIPADLSWRRQPSDPTPLLATPPVLAAMPSPRWVCLVRGHHYVTKRTPDKVGMWRVCKRCNHEKRPPRGAPAVVAGWSEFGH